MRDRAFPLLDRFTEASVVDYATRCEETLRAFAIEITRNRDRPQRWGYALMFAMREHSHVWQDFRDMLRPITARQPRGEDYAE
eukprot:1688910-Heterocapsa_arctica.AAC.1